ncbi:S13-like H2TH domain-containing protein [Vararia minispora EC-137]|uniref:S13-like H2TH domain-containing protein n=1 Tax=Vararia minispora EC-137 TaxID=1314806 RepID=A0ACB8QFB7_9AGAM|nr:S13-like H2TH domain-containing protein [Vararia minispora EC-137]
MVFIFGKQLADKLYTRMALTQFYGIGAHTAHRICARLSIHDTCRVRNLTPYQITALTAFLSGPTNQPQVVHQPLAKHTYKIPAASTSIRSLPHAAALLNPPPPAPTEEPAYVNGRGGDPLRRLKIENDLRRDVRENIAHQRMIGSYVGKRHAMHMPVRGQNTRNNAKTARKFNRVERWG